MGKNFPPEHRHLATAFVVAKPKSVLIKKTEFLDGAETLYAKFSIYSLVTALPAIGAAGRVILFVSWRAVEAPGQFHYSA